MSIGIAHFLNFEETSYKHFQLVLIHLYGTQNQLAISENLLKP